jgi:hypothetical protein
VRQPSEEKTIGEVAPVSPVRGKPRQGRKCRYQHTEQSSANRRGATRRCRYTCVEAPRFSDGALSLLKRGGTSRFFPFREWGQLYHSCAMGRKPQFANEYSNSLAAKQRESDSREMAQGMPRSQGRQPRRICNVCRGDDNLSKKKSMERLAI